MVFNTQEDLISKWLIFLIFSNLPTIRILMSLIPNSCLNSEENVSPIFSLLNQSSLFLCYNSLFSLLCRPPVVCHTCSYQLSVGHCVLYNTHCTEYTGTRHSPWLRMPGFSRAHILYSSHICEARTIFRILARLLATWLLSLLSTHSDKILMYMNQRHKCISIIWIIKIIFKSYIYLLNKMHKRIDLDITKQKPILKWQMDSNHY